MNDVQDAEAMGTFEQRGEALDLRFERLYPAGSRRCGAR